MSVGSTQTPFGRPVLARIVADATAATQAASAPAAPSPPAADAFSRDRGPVAGPPVPAPVAASRSLPLGPWSFAGRQTERGANKADSCVGTMAATPPSGEALAVALSDAIARAIQAQPTTRDDVLVDKLSSFLFTDTARDVVAAVRRGETPLLTELPTSTGSLAPADTQQPRHFHWLTMNGRSSWGGMACFFGDIFPEGYYRTRAVGGKAPSGLEKEPYVGANASKLFEQPYFRWEAGRYEFRLGDDGDNAALRIVEHLAAKSDGKVSLWRGTQEAYDTPEELRAIGDDGRYRAGGMSGFGDDFASVMTTPDRAAAEQWAHPTLVEFSFTPAELKDLVRQGLLYAGIEFHYVEVALLYDRDPASPRGRTSVDRMTVIGSVDRASDDPKSN